MKKKSTAERLRQIMDERGLRQIDILTAARRHAEEAGTGLSKADLSQYLSGKVVPGQRKLTILALALGVSETWLMGYDVPAAPEADAAEDAGSIPPGFERMPELVPLPIVGRIACGQPITAEQNLAGATAAPAAWGADFALICEGDSMAPKIQDGDLVAIRRQPEVENGQIAAVRIEDEATLKRVYLSADHITLIADNPEYKPLVFVGSEMDRVAIEGKAIGLCRNI